MTRKRTGTDRLVSAVGWWAPEIGLVALAAALGWLVWSPLWLLAALVAARIAAGPVLRRLATRRPSRPAGDQSPAAGETGENRDGERGTA